MEARPENLHTGKHPDAGPSLREPGTGLKRGNSPFCRDAHVPLVFTLAPETTPRDSSLVPLLPLGLSFFPLWRGGVAPALLNPRPRTLHSRFPNGQGQTFRQGPAGLFDSGWASGASGARGAGGAV